MSTQLTVEYCSELGIAQTEASRALTGVAGQLMPAIFFRQAGRDCFTVVLPMRLVAERLGADRGKPDQRQAEEAEEVRAANRVTEPGHAEEIARYLEQTPEYVLPPMTLALHTPATFFTVGKPEMDSGFGFLVTEGMPEYYVIDGAHRRVALKRLLSDPRALPAEHPLRGDFVAATIIIEPDITRVNQDYSDCGRARPLTASIQAIYNKRSAANRLLHAVIEGSELLAGRVEETGTALSTHSPRLYTLSYVRQFVKVFLYGEKVSSEEFDRRADEELADAEAFQAAKKRILTFLKELTAANPVLSAIVAGKWAVPEVRAEGFILLRASGLEILGKLASQQKGLRSLQKLARQLAGIDWGIDNPLWEGNLVKVRGKKKSLSSSASGISGALTVVRGVIHRG